MSTESKTFPEFLTKPRDSISYESLAARGKNAMAALWGQIALTYGFILAAIWTPEGTLKIAWMMAAATSAVVFSLAGPYSWREMGFDVRRNSATWRVLVYGLLLAFSIPMTAIILGQHVSPIRPVPWHSAWQYGIWAVLQQFILQSFLFVRLESLVPKHAVLTTALLFAVAHVPNPVLTPLTFLGGLFFCAMFRRYRNILPLGLVHAVLGPTIAASFSDSIVHHMRVGIGYFGFHP